MTIYFLRHASAGERLSDPAKDGKRPLDSTGSADAVRMGALLAALEVRLDAIYSSPLKRAVQTASLAANEMGFEEKIQIEAALAPGGSYAAFERLIDRDLGAIMVVGHNPTLSQFLGRMVGGVQIELRKAGLARVELGRGGASLEWLLTPKLARLLASMA